MAARTRTAQLLAAGALAFLAGMAAQRWTSPDEVPIASARRPAVAVAADEPETTAPGPTSIRDGIPGGFARTREGAVAAAAGYITTGQALLDLDPLSVEAAVRRMAVGEAADGQVDDTLAGLTEARRELAGGSGPVVFRQAVVAFRVEAWSPERARVSVWHVGVLARDGVAPPQAGWATSSYELVWERGDWKVWSATVVPGPAPILNDSTAPATARELITALTGFSDTGVEP